MKLFDKLYDLCFEKVPVKKQVETEKTDNVCFEEEGKFYLPCSVLFGNYAKERQNERKLKVK